MPDKFAEGQEDDDWEREMMRERKKALRQGQGLGRIGIWNVVSILEEA